MPPEQKNYKNFLRWMNAIGTNIAENPEVIQQIVNQTVQNNTFVTELSTSETFVTNLAENNTFVTEVVENNTFVTELTTNEYFITELVENNTFVTEVANNETFVTELTENNTFVTENITQITNVINGKKGQVGEIATLNASGKLTAAQARPVDINFVIDGRGSVITTGLKGFVRVPFKGTITGWSILPVQSGSLVVDIWKDTYANHPPAVADTITSGAKPTLTATTKATSSTLTGWTTAVAAGDILAFNVDSVATVTNATVVLHLDVAD